jgi:uncharacterized membrane protein YphA (DoxX/SURF4 family)
LQRGFSTFPDGLPGVGLLLLRATAGAPLIIHGAAYIVDWRGMTLLSVAVALMAIVAGLLLLVGYLTSFAGILAGISFAGCEFSWFPAPSFELFGAKLTAALGIAIVVALICLGPGAFSIDARLFGRREIIIPDGSPSPKS